MDHIDFVTAVNIDGTKSYRVQCYVRLIPGIENPKVDPLEGWTVFNLWEEGDLRKVVLLERTYLDLPRFASGAAEVLYWASQLPQVELALLMFDGVYSDCQSLFNREQIDQVYGVYSPKWGPALAFESSVLRSPEWKAIVSRAVAHKP